MNEFDGLCEQHGILKTVRKEKYPRQISFSQEFLESLAKEFYSHKLKLEENSDKPVRNYTDKVLKALKFEISHLNDRADIELEVMRQKFEEMNDERVPEVTVDGEEKEVACNDAPENTEPKDEKLCKCKRLVLKRNVSSEVKESYGNKRDYPKQDIHVNGKYVGSTTWAKSGKEAKSQYLKKNPKADPKSVKVFKGK